MSSRTAATRAPHEGQQSLWDAEPPLSEVPFVIVDLETSGTSPQRSEITEFGAVRVQGGRIVGEFASFVRIDAPLPADIVRLTGITDGDLRSAPPLEEVFPSFLEFARGAVLVAHNARFDIGFLTTAAERLGYSWDFPPAVCTLVLARRILGRGETRSFRLGDLATYFHSPTEPNHRALYDARATVDVLHGLLERVGNCGVATLSDLRAFDTRLSPANRRKSALVEDLPHAPGVYVFRDGNGHALYVGSSVDVHDRARSYFSGSDSRTRMRTMVGLVESVEAVECANELEAWVREEQLIDALQPPFNRRSRAPRRGWYAAPGTREGTATTSREPFDGALGPFRTKAEARDAVLLIGADSWDSTVEGRSLAALDGLLAEIDDLAGTGRFERAARRRDAVAPLVAALADAHSLGPIARCAELVVAQRLGARWTFAVIRHGRLAGAGTLPAGGHWAEFVDALRRGATHIEPGPGPYRGASPAGVRLVARWLDLHPTRIVAIEGEWTEPASGAQRLRDWVAAARGAAREARSAVEIRPYIKGALRPTAKG